MYATGTMPTQLGRLSLLSFLYININRLTGTVPTQVSRLTQLRTLLLSDNRFTGTLPSLPPSLETVYTFHNRFSGNVVSQSTITIKCLAQYDNNQEANCFGVVPPECDSLTQIALVNGSSSPASFRGCLNTTDQSVFSLPKSYLLATTPASSTGLFAVDVVPSTNVTLLLNETVLSVGAATAFFFAVTPVAIGIRQTNATVKPAVTVRACSCDGNSAVFSAALVNASDSLVALTVNASLALQGSLQHGRRVRGVFCARAKHHYAVGVRAGTVILKFDRLSIFGTPAPPVTPQTAFSLYLVPASGGGAISRVVELKTNTSTRPADVLLSPTVAPAEEAVLVLAAWVPLMYSVSFTLADCLLGDDSTQVLTAGVRTVSNLCPAGDRDTFSVPVQAGNFTLTVDVSHELSAPLVLVAALRVFESAQQRNMTAQPACVLKSLTTTNVSSCSWELDQSDGFLTIELATDNGDLTLAGYGVTLSFVPRDTTAPTPQPTSLLTSTSSPGPMTTTNAALTTSATVSALATSLALVATTTAAGSTDIPLIAGVAGGAVVLLALVGVAVAIGMRRRGKTAPSNELPLAVTSTRVAPSAKDEPARRTSEYGPISGASAHGEYGAAPPAKEDALPRSFAHGPMSAADAHGEFASMRADSQAQYASSSAAPESHYASTAAKFTAGLLTGSNYQAFAST
jgi:hypothetical protein